LPIAKLLFHSESSSSRLWFAVAKRVPLWRWERGLKWSDVEFGSGAINLSRAVVRQHVGEMKTEAPQKPVPMDGELAGYCYPRMKRADALRLRYWSTEVTSQYRWRTAIRRATTDVLTKVLLLLGEIILPQVRSRR